MSDARSRPVGVWPLPVALAALLVGLAAAWFAASRLDMDAEVAITAAM